jgi:hypothetical protein
LGPRESRPFVALGKKKRAAIPRAAEGAAINVAACVEIAGHNCETERRLSSFEGMLSLFNPVLHRTDDGTSGWRIESGLARVADGGFGRDQFAFSLSIRRLCLLQ